MGVVFVVNDDKSVSGFEDSSVAMLNLYNFVKIDSDIPNAIKALTEVSLKYNFWFKDQFYFRWHVEVILSR